jgi:hypothetical protein
MDIVIDIIFVCAFYLELVHEFLDHFHPEGQRARFYDDKNLVLVQESLRMTLERRSSSQAA